MFSFSFLKRGDNWWQIKSFTLVRSEKAIGNFTMLVTPVKQTLQLGPSMGPPTFSLFIEEPQSTSLLLGHIFLVYFLTKLKNFIYDWRTKEGTRFSHVKNIVLIKSPSITFVPTITRSQLIHKQYLGWHRCIKNVI